MWSARFVFAAPSVSALTGALVHHSVVARPADRARHQALLCQTLTVSFAALIFAPFFLAYRGVPTSSESLVFAFALVPLATAVLVARTGALLAGHALLCCGLLAFGLTLFVATSAGAGASLAWIVLAQWQAARAGDVRLVRLCAGIGCAALALIALDAGQTGDLSTSVLFGGLALAYALVSAREPSADPEASQMPSASATGPLLALTAALGDLVFGFDAGGSVVEVCGPCERLVDLPASEILGRGLFQLVQVADRPCFLKLIGDAAHGDQPAPATIRVRAGSHSSSTSAPHFVWIELRARNVSESAAPGVRVLAIARDVTATHQNELDVAAARASIDLSVRSKDDFLANMSHELRTPLNAIIGFSEMLGSQTLCPSDPAKRREYARIIHQSGQHLLSIVNAILDMSKIQSGTFAILAEPFALAPLIDQCCDIIRLDAQEGRIRIERDCPDGLEDIIADKRACKQILINLLSNAVKFTPADGEVRVSVRPEGNTLRLTVSDTGIGIGSSDLTRLGDPFFQASGSLARPFEGTGLGLSVVRGLIGLHGGTMTIESEPSKGTAVTIRLPLDCKAIVDKTTVVRIETIPRLTTQTNARPSEPRMKSIA